MVVDESEPSGEDGTGIEPGDKPGIAGKRTDPGDLDRTLTGSSSNEGDTCRDAIGKYEIRDMLGQGGMGAVYLGFDPLIEREVAIKVLPPSLAEDKTALKRFLAEARAVGKLNHSNSVAIYDIGQHQEQYYIVMELARGGSVGTLLDKQTRLPLKDACRITLEAAQGLEAAHAAGLIHRDVKPENLMLSGDGVVKLVDFGLAKDVGRASEMAITGQGQMLGTPLYMSPEQINGEKIDLRTDIYSLGATFYHLLTGEPPFTGNSITQVLFGHVSSARPDPRKMDPSLPAACATVIAKAMAIDPGGRYASMAEMIAELRAIMWPGQSDVPEFQDSETIDIAQLTPRVLVIEPSRLRSKVTADVFRKAGCQKIDCLTDSAEALRHAQSRSVDVAIASRQLGGIKGEDVLRRIRQGASSSEAMCVLVSSESPEVLFQQARLEGAVAYVNKQTNPDEALRAVYVGSNCTLLSVPFATGSRSDVRLDVLTQGGAIPGDVTALIRELEILDVTARSDDDIEEVGSRDRDVIIWIPETGTANSDFPKCITSPSAESLQQQCSTLVIVEFSGHCMRLRAVRRAAFIVTCDLTFDRETLQRIIDIAG